MASCPCEVDRVQPSTPVRHPSYLDLYFECSNLKDRDILSKSDPCVVLYMSNKVRRLEEIGRTEVVYNTLNPKFAKPIRVAYNFGDNQKVIVKVYDVDSVAATFKEENLLGLMECTLGQVVAGRPYVKILQCKGKDSGQMSVRALEAELDADTVQLTFWAKHLDDKDVVSKSDPFLEIYKQASSSQWQLIHRTEPINNTLDPRWKPILVSIQNLCGGDRKKPIKIECFDHDDNGSHDYIGGFTTTLEDMTRPSSSKAGFACINPALVGKKKGYKNSGAIYVSCEFPQSAKERSFLDFIFEGLKIGFTVAIDFTQSNGDPSHMTSLHHISPTAPNDYMQAIRAVGNICQDYDTDNLFPAFGFGAKIRPSWDVSHNFPINFDVSNPNCAGIDGVLDAYVKCFQRIDLSGPTIVSPIINQVAGWAKHAQMEEISRGPTTYHILLLLTDGIFNDMLETKKAIIQASYLPMSIIIIGVGSSDFSEMKELKGDKGSLALPSGEKAVRDIVEFVPFQKFKRHCPDELAREVLNEIPRQVTDYFKMRGIRPSTVR